MELHRFIDAHIEEILTEWDLFASSLVPDGAMSHRAIRDHAKEILRAIALDMRTSQSGQQQIDKSQGKAINADVDNTAASVHGALRQESAFSLIQLNAEFRALRATVLRLWLLTLDKISPAAAASMIRFNEAIDQSLAESIQAYSSSADHTRELFLAILGHDLRAPLATMSMSAEILMRNELPGKHVSDVGARVKRSAQLMSSMVDDLLGYTREKLGVGIPAAMAMVDLRPACDAAVNDAAALHPETEFAFEAHGSLEGMFDKVRVTQLLTNLLKNAAQYGERGRAVVTNVEGNEHDVVITVTNYGTIIPEKSLETIFKALVQLSADNEADQRPRTSLGLGLYVARETALAHGGSISVQSDAQHGTVFTAHLPKRFRTATQSPT